MRILTVRQPWASAIILAGKDVENRTRNIAGDYRGPVLIHAAARKETGEEWFAFAERYPDAAWKLEADLGHPDDHRGAIIGVVDLVDVHPVANPHFHPICYDQTQPNGLLEAAERGDGACSPWAHPEGQWHLVLANPRALTEPIPYRGALGLRHVDDDTTARIIEQIGSLT